MNRFLLFSLFNVITLVFLNAQVSVKANVDKSEFPEINFILHDRNPDLLSQNSYKFYELIEQENLNVDVLKFVHVEDTIDYSKDNKCVLIMVEYILSKAQQNKTFFEALENSIRDCVNKGDKVKIVAFALKPQENFNPLLLDITSQFTDDIDQIRLDISKFKKENKIFNSNNNAKRPVSAIMAALSEGIDVLANQNNSLHKSILLLSEERNNLYDVTEGVLSKAREKKIVINTIKYNQRGYSQHTIPELSKETYGEAIVLTLGGYDKRKEASKAIIKLLNNTVQRSKGNNYSVTLKCYDIIKDGENQKIIISKKNSPFQTSFVFQKPGNWIIGQFQKNLIFSIVVSVIFILILTILILFIRTKRNRRRIESDILKRKQLKAQQENEAKIIRQQQEIQKMKDLEELKQKQDQIALQQKNDKLKEISLIDKMKKIGSLPIIKYIVNGENFQFEMNKSIVYVGRDKNTNDIFINSNTISRNHFCIKFNELDSNYIVIDNNSMNGIIVNGFKVKQAILKHGDIIEITNVSFTFYI